MDDTIWKPLQMHLSFIMKFMQIHVEVIIAYNSCPSASLYVPGSQGVHSDVKETPVEQQH